MYIRTFCPPQHALNGVCYIRRFADRGGAQKSDFCRTLTNARVSFQLIYPEIEITKNKKPQARLQLFYRLFFILKITNMRQKSRDIGSRSFFLRFSESIGWYTDSPMDFWLFWLCFIIFLFKVTITNLKFYNVVYQKPSIFFIGWWLVRQRNPQARPFGFTNLYPRKKPTTVILDS